MASTSYTRKLFNALLACLAVATLGVPPAKAAAASADEGDTSQSEPASAEKSPAAPAEPPAKKPYSDEAVKHYNKGVELHQSGFLNQAISEYRSAIEADDRMEEAWSNLGGIYAAQRSYQKAAESFQKALTLKPDRPTTLNGLGTVLYARGKIEEAKAAWRAAILADPRFASAYYNMANALEGEHKNSEAIKEYVKAITVNPRMGDSFYRIATLYLKDQHQAQARVMFAKAVVLGPDAEYIRDAKKQLSALDAAFAGDAADRRETRTSVGPSTAPAKESAAPTKPVQSKSVPNAATTGNTDNLKLRPKAPPETPATTTPPKPAINIKTDANGIGTVTEDEPETPKKKKKEKKEKVEKEKKVHKNADKKENDVADTPVAQPVTPATPSTSATPTTPAPEETRTVAAPKKRSRAASTAKAPVPAAETPPRDLSPSTIETTSNNPPSLSTSTPSPDTDATSNSTSNSATPTTTTDLTGETDGKPVKLKKAKVAKVKKPKRDKFTNPEDLAKSFIVQPAEDEAKDSTTSGGAAPAPAGSSMTQPVEPTEKTEMPVPANDSGAATSAPVATPGGDQSTVSPEVSAPAATEAPSAVPQPAAEQNSETSTSSKGKHKHVLRKKHDAAESQQVIQSPAPDAPEVSDLKEMPVSPSTQPNTNTNTDTVPSQ